MLFFCCCFFTRTHLDGLHKIAKKVEPSSKRPLTSHQLLDESLVSKGVFRRQITAEEEDHTGWHSHQL